MNFKFSPPAPGPGPTAPAPRSRPHGPGLRVVPIARPPGPLALTGAQVVGARAPARAQVVVVVSAPPVTYVLLYAADNPMRPA